MPLSKVIHRNYPCMNSVLDVVFTEIDTDLAGELFTTIWQLAARYERIMSCYDPQAEVYQLNEKAITEYYPISRELLEILKECRHYHQLTNGYFDIGLRKFKQNPDLIPSPDVKFGIETIQINNEKQLIKLGSEFTAIDLGGIGKGILLREINNVLTENSVTNCFISFGGSSILTRGSHPHGSGWPVSLRNDNNPDYTFYLKNNAASISESHPHQNISSHIINPYKKVAEERRLSFILAQDPALAEVLSTTLIIAPVQEIDGIVKASPIEEAVVFDKSVNGELKLIYSLA